MYENHIILYKMKGEYLFMLKVGIIGLGNTGNQVAALAKKN